MDKNQRERLRKLYRTMNIHIYYLIYKIMCVPSFISRIEWRTMLEWLDPKEGERILDVACGVGELSLKIAERGCEVCGIDRGQYGIHIASNLAKRLKVAAEFEVGNAEDLPYRDGYFDKVVCSCALEHFDDDAKALKEMYRVLKPDGSIILTVDSFTYPISDELKEKHRKIAYVVNYYTPETLKERFEIAGFTMNRNKYLLNSRITSFFFNFGIKIKWSFYLWTVISFIVYPLCLVSERLFGDKNIGYTLAVEGKKVKSSKEL